LVSLLDIQAISRLYQQPFMKSANGGLPTFPTSKKQNRNKSDFGEAGAEYGRNRRSGVQVNTTG
jgi:hypothetical protein